MYKVLTIAGSDSSGGAGLQADLKTFQEQGVYGMSAITTIVSMDPDNQWAHQVFPQNIETIKAQLKTIIQGIGVDALKTGMLGSIEIIDLVKNIIEENNLTKIVIDPVMVCKGTNEPLTPEINEYLRDKLLPKALITTPNIFEAEQLSGIKSIQNIEDMKKAASIIKNTGCQYVLIKGGDKIGKEKAVDLLYDGNSYELLESEKINTSYTHGAGCTYSAAITAEIAKGKEVKEAVSIAKKFIFAAITNGFPLNQYIGPVNHFAYKKEN